MMAAIFVSAAIAAGALLAVLMMRRLLLVITVHGDSMKPTLGDGDRLLVRRNGKRAVRRNALIVLTYGGQAPARGTSHEIMVKRVAAGPGDAVPSGMPVSDSRVPPGRLLVIGDNAEASGDSRRTGYYATSSVVGAVIRRI